MALVFVFEDTPLNLKLIRVLLESAGHRVEWAADGESGLARLTEITPDVVLMDIQLPGMDGLEVTRRLRADPRHASMPIVAVTGYAMAEDQAAARDAGCDHFLAKPIDNQLLLQTIASITGAPAG